MAIPNEAIFSYGYGLNIDFGRITFMGTAQISQGLRKIAGKI